MTQTHSSDDYEMKRGFKAVPDWYQLPSGWEFGRVSAVAVDSQGRVYIGHRGERPIMLFDPDGRFIRSQGETEILPRLGTVYAPEEGEDVVITFQSNGETMFVDEDSQHSRKILYRDTLPFLHGMYVDHQDNLWVTDFGQSIVLKYDPEGILLLVLGNANEPGEDESHFNQPTDVVVNQCGQIFITDGYINSRIVKFSKTGKFIKAWGKRGTGKSEFNTPHAITIDRKGVIYVADRENHRIQLFDSDGNYLGEWTDLGLTGDGDELNGLRWGFDGFLYGATGIGNKIITIDSRGRLVNVWGNSPSTEDEMTNDVRKPIGQFNVQHGLSLDKQGSLFVAEVSGRRAQKFCRA